MVPTAAFTAAFSKILTMPPRLCPPLTPGLTFGCSTRATPLLARKTALAGSLDELLFALIVLGDDRLVDETVIAGASEAAVG